MRRGKGGWVVKAETPGPRCSLALKQTPSHFWLYPFKELTPVGKAELTDKGVASQQLGPS